MQNFKTVVLLAGISGLLLAIGFAIGGIGGVIIALVLAAALNIGSYWFSADIVLKSSHAREIEYGDDPRPLPHDRAGRERGRDADAARLPHGHAAAERLRDRAQPQARRRGGDDRHPPVAQRPELRGVIGHEMAHVANRDILTSSIVATVASAISFISFFAFWFGGRRGGWGVLIAAIVAPIAATVIQLAISRSREYQADSDGARFVQDPEALAAALATLERGAQQIPREVSQATAHLYIVNPLRGGRVAGLFSTHPPLEKRIERLRQMGGYVQ